MNRAARASGRCSASSFQVTPSNTLRMPEFQPDEFNSPDNHPVPKHWIEAIPALISSRFGIFRYEAQQAISSMVSRSVLIAIGALFFLCAWVLLVAGGVGWVSARYEWPWYQVALGASGVHFILAVMVSMIMRAVKRPCAFPLTCQEFEKDRQWLNQLKHPPNSQH
ncbi:MAG: hypothetical protein RL346_1636 [Verrucomicrobiota bacterium]|jgi:hypothetical protein